MPIQNAALVPPVVALRVVPEPAPTPARWTFLTNHAHVLLAIARDPNRTLREVARSVGITERAAHKIVADLETAGYLQRRRNGRRNSYLLAHGQPLRHPMTVDHDVDDLLGALVEVPRRPGDAKPARAVEEPRSLA